MNQSALERDVTLLQRAPMLAACRDGPVGRSGIAEEAGCSRTTAYRATTDLTDRGLLEQVDGGYRLTGLGRTALDSIERFHAEVEGARHLEPVLAHVDAAELREHMHLFADATVMEASPEAPYAIERHVESVIAEVSERIHGISNSFGSPAVLSQIVDRVEAGVDFEWAFPEAVHERIERQQSEHDARLSAQDNTTVYVVEDVVVDVSLFDDTLVLAGFDDRGTLGSVAITDDSDAVAWAQELIERYCERGTLLPSGASL